MPIQILSEIVASQIAAGEVVERPASVVKELVENALDAGSTLIRVESEGGGRSLIRVTDNGSGIASGEAELAFARHATSKLQSVDDLYSIQTLGFRGEALASIASVSQVTLLTRTAHEKTGTLIRVRGGVSVERRASGTPVGTVLTVENLFFNTPARLKFLKAETTERRHIDQIITRYAMAYPNVRFMLIQDGKQVFQTTGNGSLADVLVEALGLDIMRQMIEVQPTEQRRSDLPPISVSGFASEPSLNRNTRSHIILFVNGRAVQDSSLSYAVTQAYHTLMPGDRYPLAVLLVNLPPEEVDVNVHPSKAEVRFRSPDAVFSALQSAVRRAVVRYAPVPGTTEAAFDREDTGDRFSAAGLMNFPARPLQQSFNEAVIDSGLRPQQTAPQPYSYPTVTGHGPPAVPVPTLTAPPYATGQAVRKLPPMRVIGQVAATYIIAEGPAGMYLIDQHAAHERILYEQFMAQQQSREPVAQRALEGQTIDLSAGSAQLVRENLPLLESLGFEIDLVGKSSIRVRAVPGILADRSPDETIQIVLNDLESGVEPGAATLEAKIILRVCKAAAVKAGQILSYSEMQAMIRMLEQCEFPRTCPHGRPTMIHMSSDQLAKEFGRT